MSAGAPRQRSGTLNRKEPDGIAAWTFNIYLDGDLFKVTITFDEAVKEKKPMSPMIVPEPVQEEAQQDV